MLMLSTNDQQYNITMYFLKNSITIRTNYIIKLIASCKSFIIQSKFKKIIHAVKFQDFPINIIESYSKKKSIKEITHIFANSFKNFSTINEKLTSRMINLFMIIATLIIRYLF